MEKSNAPKTKNPPAKPAAIKSPPAPAPGKVPPLFRRIDWLALLIAFAVVGIIYFLTLAPEETLEDSGELCTGAFYAGIPHAPGYPFWTIYAWIWTKLLFVGNVAWRVEVGEAFAAAMGCGLVAFMVSRGSSMLMEGIEELKSLTGKWENAICLVSGATAGVLLGLGGVMWSESVAINRISLFGVPWIMALALCLMRWIYAPRQLRYLFFAMFFFGICVTVHQTLLVAAMAIEATVAYVNPKLGRNLFFGNTLVYLGLLGVEQIGVSTMLNTSGMVLFLFHTVGILSFATFVFLVLKFEDDLIRPGRDAVMLLLSGATVLLFFVGMKYPQALVLFAGAVWVLIWLSRKTRAMGWEWLVVIGMGLVWTVGASFYFYEAIAGMTDPPMQWAYPRTVEGFFHALSRGQYERAQPSNFLANPLYFLLQIGMLISDIVHEYNWVCLFVALVPLMFFFKMKKRERAWIIALTSLYACIGLLLLVLMNPAPDKQSADLNRVFFTSSHAVVAILIGYGFALTAAYIATHYQNFRRAALILGVVALVPGLIAFYTGISNTFYGGLGVTPYQYILLLFFLIAGAIVLAALAGQRLFRLASGDGKAPAVTGQSPVPTANREQEQLMFFVFAGLSLVLLGVSIWLVLWRPESLTLAQIREGLGRLFAPHQYSLPAIAGLLVLAIVVAFIGALLIYRRRAPLVVTLILFALFPIASGLSHWAGSEQRNHWFGYWFGHDMFTPPVTSPDGKMTYDSKVREQMMKGTNASLVYPEMTPNTILFGGTDPGRFNPTYMIFCDSFLETNCLPAADPTFDRRDVYLITQNALADGTYLDYLRAQYFRSQQSDPPFFSELARFLLKDDKYSTNLLAKLVSPLDWYFEGRGARIEKRWRTFTSWFSGEDFLNLKSFADKLRERQDPVSKWLFENFNKETQDLLANPSADETRLRDALTRDLNILLERELKQRQHLKDLQKDKSAVDQKIWISGSSSALQEKQAALVKEIAAVKIEPLYDTNRFARVQISDYLKSFIDQNPLGDTRIRLNRLLLEAAYPAEIAQSKGGVYPDREIYIPSQEDLQIAFSEYSTDAARRKQHDDLHPNEPRQLKPGEYVTFTEDGRVQVSGQVAVMAINGLLTKVIFDHNSRNDFYVEESFPLDWMFPHLTPFGIIMKINRQTVPEITDEICRRDHEFWAKYSDRLVGNWMNDKTSLQDIVNFAERVYLRHDFTGFTGDLTFVRDESAQKAFSKLRSALGGIYSWRLGVLPNVPTPPEYLPKNDAERQRMFKEAEFAYRQSFAFCPYSPEVVYRYVNLLMSQYRFKDALLVVQTCRKFDPQNSSIIGLEQQLEGYAKAPNAALEIQHQAMQLESDLSGNSNDFQKAINLMQSYAQIGQNDRAFQAMDRILENPHAPAEALAAVTQYAFKLNNPAKAETALDKLVALKPADVQTCGLIAEAYAQLNKTDKVDAAVARMQQLAPRQLQTWLYTAQAYAQLNQLPKMESALEKVVELEPNQPETWYDLASAKAALGKPDAFHDLRRAIELSDKRLAQNTNAQPPNDLRATIERDPRFAQFHTNPEYKAAIAK